jgi:hypothetical protein
MLTYQLLLYAANSALPTLAWRRTMILMLSLIVIATGVCGLKLLVYEALSY